MRHDPDDQRPRTGRARRVRRVVSWTAVGAAATVIATSGWLYHQVSGKIDSVDLHSELGTDRPEPAADAVPARAVLLLGSDSATDTATGDAEAPDDDTATADDGAGDALPAVGSAMLVHLPEDGSPTAVPLPHDTRVPSPECAASEAADDAAPDGDRDGRVSFAAVHAAGGPSCVVRVAERLSGIRMDHYLEVDFAGFGDLVDALGGLTVTTTEPIRNHEAGRELPAGTHELTGDEAMTALRAADPAEQQRFLLALLAEVDRQDILTSPTRLYRVADAAASSLTTDSDLGSLTDLLAFVRELTADGADDLEIRPLPAEDDGAESFWQALRAGG